MKKYKYLLGLILTLAIVYSIYFFSTKNIQADRLDDKLPTYESDNYREKLVNELLKTENRPQNRKEIWKIFCETILSGGVEWDEKSFDFAAGFKKDNVEYIPKNSFFVYYFCDWLAQDKNLKKNRAIWKEKFKDQTQYDLTNLTLSTISYKDVDPRCDVELDMNNCSYWVLASKIYETLMNDFVNAKVAWTMIANANIEEDAIKKFSNENFWTWDENYYLYKSKVEWIYNYTSHPETYKKLADLLKNLKKFNWKYINTKKIQFASDTSNPEYKDLYLALTDTNYMYFQNLLQKEFFWLNMFVWYYTTSLPWNSFFVPTRAWLQASEAFDELAWELAISNDKLSIMSDTVDLTQSMIRNIQTSFPVYIWLLAIKEDLLILRTRLAQLYTPIHQLHYKLMNVQDTKRN